MTTRTTSASVKIALLGAACLLAGVVIADPSMHGERGHGPMPFDEIDADKDGKITREEADAFHQAQQAGLDADQDGFVSFEEAKAHRRAKREEHARARFAALDADGDGKVALSEMPQPHGRMFDRLDRNDDGVVERDELPQRGERMGKQHGR